MSEKEKRMRCYLFRGKRKDNGEWVFGGLYQYDRDTVYIMSEGINYEVDPETVGQYIGLTDEKFVMIFDGDILTADEYPFQDEGKPNYYGVVCWFDDSAQFGYELKCVNPEKNGISDGICEAFGNSDYKFKIVGNIHDNPELLEGKK